MADQLEASPTLSRDILRFTIKICIAAFVTVLAVDWIVQSAIDGIQESTAQTVQMLKTTLSQSVTGGGAPFWAKVEKALDDAASENMPPEKKQKLLHDIGAIVTQYKPF